MSDITLRLRAFLSAWFTVLVAALLILTAAGAWGTYAIHVDPATTTEERVVGEWSTTGNFDHHATVTRENPVFPIGTELTNRSTYFTRATPELNGSFSAGYEAGMAENVTVELDATLVLQSSDQETKYWTDRTALDSTESTDVQPGELVTVGFGLNISRIADRIDEIRTKLGSTPGETTAFVAVDVHVAGTIEGERSRLRFTERLPVGIDGDMYTVSDPGTRSESVERTETVQTPRESGPIRSFGAPLLLLIGLVTLTFLGYNRMGEAFELTKMERERLAFVDDREEFDEWIVQVRLPPEAFQKPRAEAASLADLVNFAIDTDTGVVKPPEEEAFYVIGREYLYAFRPPVNGTGEKLLDGRDLREARRIRGNGSEREQEPEMGSTNEAEATPRASGDEVTSPVDRAAGDDDARERDAEN